MRFRARTEVGAHRHFYSPQLCDSTCGLLGWLIADIRTVIFVILLIFLIFPIALCVIIISFILSLLSLILPLCLDILILFILRLLLRLPLALPRGRGWVASVSTAWLPLKCPPITRSYLVKTSQPLRKHIANRHVSLFDAAP